jgi:transcriptional regulator with XRE-family HTH domain
VSLAALRAERQRRGLSQRALAAELGVGLRSVLRWENGESEPSGLYVVAVENWLKQTNGAGTNGKRKAR